MTQADSEWDDVMNIRLPVLLDVAVLARLAVSFPRESALNFP
jgi:hypothetical protein